ncbi:hypothetical protein CEXT_540591 [Caerostris extrusa]|uniref:Uncharacterized protein n=1 Tax=Caerostris extrusa TaxID=172846 RepID=A0AAV4N9H7_CAEEX|nr:hypothetical protein CEXT_540591 [Caerostris extrusa]
MWFLRDGLHGWCGMVRMYGWYMYELTSDVWMRIVCPTLELDGDIADSRIDRDWSQVSIGMNKAPLTPHSGDRDDVSYFPLLLWTS